MKKVKLIISAMVMAGSMLPAISAAAAPPPGSGWDSNPDIAVGGGSDTTYLVSQRLEALYNAAPGCDVEKANVTNKGKCAAANVAIGAITTAALTSNVATITTSNVNGYYIGLSVTVAGLGAPYDGTFIVTGVPTTTSFTYAVTSANIASAAVTGTATPGADTAVTNGNYDHDLMVSATPAGSGAGINALLATGKQYNPAISYARSSRGPSGTEASETTFWGYARDGIAVNTFGSRAGYRFTQANLKDIYQCVKTDWSQFNSPGPDGVTGTADDTPGAGQVAVLAPGTIIPWDMNSQSGTSATFKTYLGGITFGACVRKLTSGIAPFENDVKPLLADRGPDGTFGTADDDENNFIWWMSYGNYSKYPFTVNGCADAVGTYTVASGVCTGGTTISGNLVRVDGSLPSNGTISGNTYAILRSLYQVTKNTDADCRAVAGSVGACDNVADEVSGATSGPGGAVRQFTKWLCTPTNGAQNSVTGNFARTEIVAALNTEGFQQLNPAIVGLRSPGYACEVKTQ